jgi:Arc/MetJ family transcription regulator
MRMKRTNLVLDEKRLEQAKSLSGARTYSEAVNLALQEYVRQIRFRGILDLQGSGAWEGDLSVVRQDKRPARRSRK